MSSEFPFPLYYLGLFLVIVLLSRFVFRRYIGFANRYNLVKSNNERVAHKGLVFTGGGVVYVTVIMVAAVVIDNLDFVEFATLSPVIATSLLITLVGFYNDFITISPFNKFIILIFLILMLLYSNATIPVIQNLNGFLGTNNIGFFPGLILTSFVYILIINAISLFNRIDGYLPIFAILFFISLLYNFDINEFYTLNSVSVIIIGCSAMFLRYNFSKKGKKLFLGDAGSLFIGYWIATYLITYITSAPNSTLVDVYSIQLQNIPLIAISMISIPVLDILRVTLLRIINKTSIFPANRNHFHHILIDGGMTHLRTSLFLVSINWFNCIAIFLIEQNFNSKELTIVYIFICLLWYVFFEYLNRKNINSQRD